MNRVASTDEIDRLQADVERRARHLGSLTSLHEFVGNVMSRNDVTDRVRESLSPLPPEEQRGLVKEMLLDVSAASPLEASRTPLRDEAARFETALREILRGYPVEMQATLVKRFLVRLTSTSPLEQSALSPDLETIAKAIQPATRHVLAARLVNAAAVKGDPEVHFLSRHTEDEWIAAGHQIQEQLRAVGDDKAALLRMAPAGLSPLRRHAEPPKYQRPQYGKLSERCRADVDRIEHYMRTQIAVGEGDAVEMYLRAGAVWFECGFRERDDIEAFATATRLLDHVDAGPANEVLRMGESFNMHVGMFCGRWFASGAPRVRLSAAQAASLMLTDLPRDFVDAELHHPWPAFIVDLPEGLVPIGDGSDWAKRVLVHRVQMCNRDCLWWMMVQGAATGLSVGRRSLYDLQNEDELRGDTADGDGDVVIMGLRMRTTGESFSRFAAVAKLIAGICYKLQERPPKPTRSPGGGAIRRRPGGPPQTTEIKLGFPVKVDFSNLVREHLLGHVKRLAKVQWLVRGHWRHQVCGPGRLERKTIWIEPFWKGPIDAPILVRDYVMKNMPVRGAGDTSGAEGAERG